MSAGSTGHSSSRDDLIPISALQHYLFCSRQCALIHIDGLWAENRLTVEGQLLHRRVDQRGRRIRPDRSASRPSSTSNVRIVRAMPLISHFHGIVGKADTIEFRLDSHHQHIGPPRPVEHKRGGPKRIKADRVQLCAQALCLEDMFDTDVPEGEIFYNRVRRREHVQFSEDLRTLTRSAIDSVRTLFHENVVPRARKQAKCKSCSLIDLCLPRGTGPDRSPSRYTARSLAASLNADSSSIDEEHSM